MILLLLDTNHDRPLRSYSLAFNFLRLELFIEIIHLFSARDVASYEFYNFFFLYFRVVFILGIECSGWAEHVPKVVECFYLTIWRSCITQRRSIHNHKQRMIDRNTQAVQHWIEHFAWRRARRCQRNCQTHFQREWTHQTCTYCHI